MIREGMIWAQPEWSEKMNHVGSIEHNSRQKNSKYKGPEAGAQSYSWNNTEANLAGVNNGKNDGQ